MNKKVAMKWVKALRSGKYLQGKERLQNGDTYCCLGVLCAIAPKGLAFIESDNTILGHTLLNQCKVLKWAGLKSGKGYYKDGSYSLVGDNDRGKSFEKIANIIEQNIEEL